jgi:hypothetical protein
MGIVCDRSREGGLDAPGVQLVKQPKAAVERAYPQIPPPAQEAVIGAFGLETL